MDFQNKLESFVFTKILTYNIDKKVVWSFGSRNYSEVLKGNYSPYVFQFSKPGALEPT